MFQLYLITHAAPPAEIAAAVERALCEAPGEHIAVQLRAKHLPTAELSALAHELRGLTQRAGARLLINDRLDIAQLCRADGVQLPEKGLTPGEARTLLGAHALLGVSCHDAAGLARAHAQGASFATLSPVFAVPGKGRPLGTAGFAALTRDAKLPVVALGGIAAGTIPELRRAGAAGIAVIRHVFGSDDPSGAVLSCLQAWQAQ